MTEYQWELIEKNKLALKGTDYWVSMDIENGDFIVWKGDTCTIERHGVLAFAKVTAELRHGSDLIIEDRHRCQSDLKELGLIND